MSDRPKGEAEAWLDVWVNDDDMRPTWEEKKRIRDLNDQERWGLQQEIERLRAELTAKDAVVEAARIFYRNAKSGECYDEGCATFCNALRALDGEAEGGGGE